MSDIPSEDSDLHTCMYTCIVPPTHIYVAPTLHVYPLSCSMLHYVSGEQNYLSLMRVDDTTVCPLQ